MPLFKTFAGPTLARVNVSTAKDYYLYVEGNLQKNIGIGSVDDVTDTFGQIILIIRVFIYCYTPDCLLLDTVYLIYHSKCLHSSQNQQNSYLTK